MLMARWGVTPISDEELSEPLPGFIFVEARLYWNAARSMMQATPTVFAGWRGVKTSGTGADQHVFWCSTRVLGG